MFSVSTGGQNNANLENALQQQAKCHCLSFFLSFLWIEINNQRINTYTMVSGVCLPSVSKFRQKQVQKEARLARPLRRLA